MTEEEPRDASTPWAPWHLRPVHCCCRHPDAWECGRGRHISMTHPEDPDGACECCCHERDLDEED